MTKHAWLAGTIMLALALGVAAPGGAQTTTGSTGSTPPAQPDNTRANRAKQPTADQQKQAKDDRELTRQIRRAITSDKQLSTYAHNVKIITRGGKVTLAGPVRSPEEKQAIEAKATDVAGAGNVTNNIQIAPKNKQG